MADLYLVALDFDVDNYYAIFLKIGVCEVFDIRSRRLSFFKCGPHMNGYENYSFYLILQM